ncbi:MAG: hypothetical protein GX364_07995 [Firmicutes bacterium]|nr:hypothetical protein [Bacillota bacterium]
MEIIIILVIGVQVLLTGILIRYKMFSDHEGGQLSPQKKQEATGKSRFAGIVLIFVGVLSFPAALLIYLLPTIRHILFYIYALGIIPAGGIWIHLNVRR